MIVENIQKIIDVVKAEDKYFDMSQYSKGSWQDQNVCYTPSCICGWANYIASGTDNAWELTDHVTAAEWLGISEDNAEQLFLCFKMDVDGFELGSASTVEVTRAETIAVLEGLIKDGTVDWTIAESYEEHV